METAKAEASKVASLRILVIDDIPDVADVMKMLLDLEGFETQVAYNGPAALQLAREFSPDVIFCDIGLPGMDGHEIARRVRKDPAIAQVILIALTGWGAEGEVRKTRESGFDFHMVKPVDSNALLELLSHVAPRDRSAEPA
jgi:CheY-like chemotaxis protein